MVVFRDGLPSAPEHRTWTFASGRRIGTGRVGTGLVRVLLVRVGRVGVGAVAQELHALVVDLVAIELGLELGDPFTGVPDRGRFVLQVVAGAYGVARSRAPYGVVAGVVTPMVDDHPEQRGHPERVASGISTPLRRLR